MRAPQVARHLVAIAAALKPLGIRWYVFDAQAVIAAGAVRVTADIDITTVRTFDAQLASATKPATG